MGRKVVVLLPDMQKKLTLMGEQIKLARLRRDLPVELVAERASAAPPCGAWKKEVLRSPLGTTWPFSMP